MELDQLRQIIDLLKAEGLTEITVSEGDQRITVKRELHGVSIHPAAVTSPAVGAEGPAAATADEPEGTFSLASPLVGTFYRRSSRDVEPFVAVGDVVSAGDTICVIEAMKVMNEIHAEEAGRVREVLVDDGDAVEYGEALFLFDPP